MELLLVRHGAAVERDTPGMRDEERPLTPEGEKRFRQAARGLARIEERPYAILSSPAVRAHRTAELLSEAWGGPAVTVAPALAGGSFADLETVLADYPRKAVIALVGHEPSMSSLVARLLGTTAAERLAFKKGGVAKLEVAESLASGASLEWFLPPRVLREVGG